MPVTVVIGAQWGDEGKGRFVDLLSENAQVVARYAGGDNAGHTVNVGDTVYKLHLIPSGILRENAVSVMGNGMVINPVSLWDEITRLRDMGVRIEPDNLIISSRAHVITLAHIEQDRAREKARGKDAIGTTLKGIGPAYLDKVGRRGIRTEQWLDMEQFGDAMQAGIGRANQELREAGLPEVGDVKMAILPWLEAAEKLKPFLKDTTVYLYECLQDNARVICEGAQGALLDIDHGSYPFVTGSSPTVGGALTGLGIGATTIDRVLGIAKAFNTRVGAGPMPTELDGEIAERLRGTGENFFDEFGTTTGRSRRCGWLDTVILRYSAIVNGFTELALTKLDILSGFETLKLAVAYELDGEHLKYPPSTVADLARVTPVYETLPGWQDDVTGAKTSADLPENARNYIRRIAELCEIPVTMVSVGPERTQLVHLT